MVVVDLQGRSTKEGTQDITEEVEVVDTSVEEVAEVVVIMYLVEEEARATLVAVSQQAPPPTLYPAPLESLL